MLQTHTATHRNGKPLALALACLLALALLPAGPPRAARAQEAQMIVPDIAPGHAYRQFNIVSDSPGLATSLEPLLVNPWGVASRSGGPLWVANNGSRTAQPRRSLIGGLGFVPDESLPKVSISGGRPMALVANTTGDFNVTPAGGSPAPAHFIFSIDREPVDEMGGHLAAWQPASGDTVQVFGPTGNGIFYTGLAVGSNAGGNRLYAARFPAGIDVFDGAFTPTTVTGGFLDPTIPADYFPYNIRNLGGSLYVTYAKRGAGVHGVRNGQGFGLVRKFDTNGVRDPAFGINDGPTSQLNAPWGMEIAPASFGVFKGALLVGNFSDRESFSNSSDLSGRVNAYDKDTGEFLGTLRNEEGSPVEIDGLRALHFGAGGAGGDPGTLYFTAGFADESHGLLGGFRPTTEPTTSLFEFGADEYVTHEGSHLDVTVVRSGDVGQSVQVNYATFEDSRPFSGLATQRGDYQIALGTLQFNPGETSKTFRLLTPNDTYFETDERIAIALSNPVGTGAGLGNQTIARVRLVANDQTLPETITPVTDAPSSHGVFSAFFVRQHYLDFLNREADLPGGVFWVNQIESCGGDTQCRELRRVNVSAAFFLSIEFQQTGMLAYLANRSAFGARPLYGEFMRDTQALQRNVAFGQPGAAEQLEANKRNYFRDFVSRRLPFADKYPVTMTPAQFVDALFANFSATHEERLAAIDEFGSATETSNLNARARVLRRAAENPDFARREFNAAFVTMEYFGYLRRDPDEAGFRFWLSKLDAANGNFIEAEMVKAFINSIEYRTRFGPHSTN